MFSMIGAAISSYMAILLLASINAKHRKSCWSVTLSNLHLWLIRSLSIALISIAVSTFTSRYGTSIGLSVWLGLSAPLALLAMMSISYISRYLISQIFILIVLLTGSLIVKI